MQKGQEGGFVGGERREFFLGDVQRAAPPADGEGARVCLAERTELGATLVAHAARVGAACVGPRTTGKN